MTADVIFSPARPALTRPEHCAAVLESLERAAELGGDLTDAVYQHLFAAQPELEPLFWRDRDGSIRGEMLNRAFEALLDFIEERRYADMMLRCEIITHGEFGVPRTLFTSFFPAVAETVQTTLGPDWTPDMAAAWKQVISDLQACMENLVD
jgi:hemoglobin-like flavoprotein